MCDNNTALLIYSKSSESPYGWCCDLFGSQRNEDSQQESIHGNADKNKKRYVSYDMLGSMIGLLCPILSSYICKAQAALHGRSDVQPVIAISIPEGPYLVLAVLLVHTLACQSSAHSSHFDTVVKGSISGQPCELPSSTKKSKHTMLHHAAPVLVPMDPNEGIERLCHMILDSQPCIILVASADDEKAQPSDDWNKVQTAVGSIKSSESMPYHPLILSMKSLLNEALLQHADPSIHLTVLEDPTLALKRYLQYTKRQLGSRDESTSPEGSIGCMKNCVSHIVFTSGTTGRPKGCISSLYSLWNYVYAKNLAHSISINHDVVQQTLPSSHTACFAPRVLLASALSFDPCLSDIIATYYAKATLVIASRQDILHHLHSVLQESRTTHALCTPSLWNTLTPLLYSRQDVKTQFPFLKVVALGGEPIPRRIVSLWAAETSIPNDLKLLATYGVTEACVYQTAGEIFCDNKGYDNIIQDVRLIDDSHHNQKLVGQDVGNAFSGTKIRICKERNQDLDILSCT